MNEINDQASVFAAWNAVMREVREIRKAETGKGVSYSFRGIDTVTNAVGPRLREHGVTVTPHQVTDLRWREFTSKSGTAMLEAFLRVTYRVYGPGGDFFEGGSAGQASDASDKAVAQAMSVAYRTFLLQSLTMPTDDPEPDLNVVERQNAAEAEAHALGWQSAAARDEAWAAGVAAMGHLDDPTTVIKWGKSLDPRLSVESLTPAMEAEWRARIEEAAKPDVAGSLLDTLAPDDSPAAADPPADDFDRAAVWATLHEWHGQLRDQERFDKIERWIEAENISDDTLTREQAETWRAGMEGQPLKANEATTDAKAQGWKSKAERERTFTSLTERTANLPESVQSIRTVIASFTEHFTKESLTKQDATEWLALIEEALEEPF